MNNKNIEKKMFLTRKGGDLPHRPPPYGSATEYCSFQYQEQAHRPAMSFGVCYMKYNIACFLI